MHNFFVNEGNRHGDFYYITDGDFNILKTIIGGEVKYEA